MERVVGRNPLSISYNYVNFPSLKNLQNLKKITRSARTDQFSTTGLTHSILKFMYNNVMYNRAPQSNFARLKKNCCLLTHSESEYLYYWYKG